MKTGQLVLLTVLPALLLGLLPGSAGAQTTTVRGYWTKGGKYVAPHQRTVKPKDPFAPKKVKPPKSYTLPKPPKDHYPPKPSKPAREQAWPAG